MGKFKTALNKLAYLPSGEFSVSRILMVYGVFQMWALLWVGVGVYLFNQTTLPDNVYTFAGVVMGISGAQYGYRHRTNKAECPEQPGAV